jgi:hypothetical protein
MQPVQPVIVMLMFHLLPQKYGMVDWEQSALTEWH